MAFVAHGMKKLSLHVRLASPSIRPWAGGKDPRRATGRGYWSQTGLDTRNQARDQTRVSKEPAGLDFEPAGLDLEPVGLELKPVGLELEPAGLEFGPKSA